MILLLFFSSCGGELVITLYVQDLLDLKEGKEKTLNTKVNIVAEGVDDENQIIFIRENINGVGNEMMVKRNYMDAFSFDADVPVFGPDSGDYPSDGKDIIYISLKGQDDKMYLAFKFNENVIERINDWISSSYLQTLNIEDYDIYIKLENDSRDEDFTFSAASVFAGGMAFPFEYSTSLKRRENVILKISDVLSSAVQENTENIYFLMF